MAAKGSEGEAEKGGEDRRWRGTEGGREGGRGWQREGTLSAVSGGVSLVGDVYVHHMLTQTNAPISSWVIFYLYRWAICISFLVFCFYVILTWVEMVLFGRDAMEWVHWFDYLSALSVVFLKGMVWRDMACNENSLPKENSPQRRIINFKYSSRLITGMRGVLHTGSVAYSPPARPHYQTVFVGQSQALRNTMLKV